MKSRKTVLMNPFARQQWRHIESRLMDMGQGEEGQVGCKEKVTWKHPSPYVK